MKMIVGLGNPGGKFQYTRHNIGFMVVEKFVNNRLPVYSSRSAWHSDKKKRAEYCKIADELLIVKPQTFMNLSGDCVSGFATLYKIHICDIWVVHDDIDLPIGKMRIRVGGASAGHRGVASLIEKLGSSDFIRFRLGIGRGKLDEHHSTDWNISRQEVEKFVVSPFADSEGGDVKKLIKHAVKALEMAHEEGLEKAMNQWN